MIAAVVPAGELIGHEGEFRLAGGRAVYEAVLYNEETARGSRVRLGRLEVTVGGGIRQINRYVDWEAPVEVLRDFTAEAAAELESHWETGENIR